MRKTLILLTVIAFFASCKKDHNPYKTDEERKFKKEKVKQQQAYLFVSNYDGSSEDSVLLFERTINKDGFVSKATFYQGDGLKKDIQKEFIFDKKNLLSKASYIYYSNAYRDNRSVCEESRTYDENGFLTQVLYSENGDLNRIKIECNDGGYITKKTTFNGANDKVKEEKRIYNADDKITSAEITDDEGNKEKSIFFYNEKNLVKETAVYKNDELKSKLFYNYNDLGLVTKVNILNSKGHVESEISYTHYENGLVSTEVTDYNFVENSKKIREVHYHYKYY